MENENCGFITHEVGLLEFKFSPSFWLSNSTLNHFLILMSYFAVTYKRLVTIAYFSLVAALCIAVLVCS